MTDRAWQPPGTDHAGLPDSAASRRRLQVILAVLSAILPVRLTGLLAGPKALPSGGVPDATTDSEYRFVSAFWLASAPVIWSELPRIEQRTGLFRFLTAVIFLGGLGRLLAWRQTGRPHPCFPCRDCTGVGRHSSAGGVAIPHCTATPRPGRQS